MAADSWRRRDHPRLRGEKRRGFITRTYTHGSPPLTRGKEVERLLLFLLLGITPAYAGKRRREHPPQTAAEDHPRLRGEKRRRMQTAGTHIGSPPLTRGKVELLLGLILIMRITPAYAGKSTGWPWSGRGTRDHPRLRGEKRDARKVRSAGRGSPPLTRGKGVSHARLGKAVGITPAYAGKSVSAIFLLPPLWDHPRLRGEKELPQIAAGCRRGSPPLTRGKGLQCISTLLKARITPAYAGKSRFLGGSRGGW